MTASRPKDAATLILLRGSSPPRVLLGRRPSRDQWADAYVFPGGRVDPQDSRVVPATALRPEVAACVTKGASAVRARALGVAAIRELMEETGLILGQPGRPTLRSSSRWRAFEELGLAPALGELDYLCRAITPPYRRKRFNARFFVADASHVHGELGGSGELADLRWFSLAEARRLNLPRITERMLGELEQWMKEDPKRAALGRTPLYRTRYGLQEQILE